MRVARTRTEARDRAGRVITNVPGSRDGLPGAGSRWCCTGGGGGQVLRSSSDRSWAIWSSRAPWTWRTSSWNGAGGRRRKGRRTSRTTRDGGRPCPFPGDARAHTPNQHWPSFHGRATETDAAGPLRARCRSRRPFTRFIITADALGMFFLKLGQSPAGKKDGRRRKSERTKTRPGGARWKSVRDGNRRGRERATSVVDFRGDGQRRKKQKNNQKKCTRKRRKTCKGDRVVVGGRTADRTNKNGKNSKRVTCTRLSSCGVCGWRARARHTARNGGGGGSTGKTRRQRRPRLGPQTSLGCARACVPLSPQSVAVISRPSMTAAKITRTIHAQHFKILYLRLMLRFARPTVQCHDQQLDPQSAVSLQHSPRPRSTSISVLPRMTSTRCDLST